MKFDPGIFLYLIFLAIILYGNHLKKRKQAQERAAQERRRTEVSKPERVVTSSGPQQLQPPDIEEWLGALWGNKAPEPTPTAIPAPPPVKKSLHDQRREKQLASRKIAALEETPRMRRVVDPVVQGVARRVPIDAARFKTREDLRRAIVARVVFAPPKSLE
jgi:hypothetical protein